MFFFCVIVPGGQRRVRRDRLTQPPPAEAREGWGGGQVVRGRRRHRGYVFLFLQLVFGHSSRRRSLYQVQNIS